jgi:HPt (histidine-containing phosphotransfer) domain-containing protein
LFENDADFKLELQGAVIAEVVRGMFANDLKTDIDTMITNQVKAEHPALIQALQDDENLRKILDERLKALVQSVRSGSSSYANTRELSTEANALVRTRVEVVLTEAVEKALAPLEDRVQKRMERLTRELEEQFDKALKDADHSWRTEAFKDIKADIVKRLSEAMGN